MALTVNRVKKLFAQGRYGDGGGLYLQITPSGGRSWILRYQRAGRERWFGLGPLRDVTLDEARQGALKARQRLREGIDPINARKANRDAVALEAAKRITFKDAAQQYFDGHEAKWSNAEHRRQFLSSLQTFAFPVIGNLPVATVDTGLVLKVIEPHWKDKNVTANRVRSRIENVLDWATVRGYRTGGNPARWDGHLAEVLPAKGKIATVKHHLALPYSDVPAFMVQIAVREGIDARALEFLILTAGRTAEVILARWPEIDFGAKVWTIPAERMKSRREHRVPLSDRAIAILKALPREVGFIFIGSRKNMPMGRASLRYLLAAMEQDVTVHGFRSSFRDWAAEQSAFPREVIEGALAHRIGDASELAYKRTDLLEKRRKLMEAWERYVATPQGKRDVVTTVTPIRRGA